MGIPRAEKAYEKYAWVIFLALGGISLTRAFYVFVIAGYDAQFLAGYGYLASGLIIIAITLKGYIYRRRWSWYALWYVPIGNVVAAYEYDIVGLPWQTFIPPFILAIMGLLLPYRKFFPKKC